VLTVVGRKEGGVDVGMNELVSVVVSKTGKKVIQSNGN
jgi:hypothetical protein